MAQINTLRTSVDELKDVLLDLYLGDPDCIRPVVGEVEEMLMLLASITEQVLI